MHTFTLNAFILSIGMILGRLLGFMRDYSIVAIFGVGELSDFFVVLVSLPDFLMFLVGGSLFASIAVPWYRAGPTTDVVANWLAGTLPILAVSLFVIVVFAFFGDYVIQLLIPSLPPAVFSEYQGYLLFVAALFPLVLVTQLRICFLQSVWQFSVTAASTSVFNLGFMMALGALLVINFPYDLAILLALSLAVFLRCGYLVAYKTAVAQDSVGKDYLSRPRLEIKRFVSAIIAGGGILLLPILVRSYEASAGVGYATYFHVVWRLYEFALGIISYSVVAAILPTLGKKESQDTVNTSLMLVLAMLTLVSVVTYVGSLWIANILGFLISADEAGILVINYFVKGYAPCIVFYGLVLFTASILVAEKSTLRVSQALCFSLVAVGILGYAGFSASAAFALGLFGGVSVLMREFVKVTRLDCLELTIGTLGLVAVALGWSAFSEIYLKPATMSSALMASFGGLLVIGGASLLCFPRLRREIFKTFSAQVK